MKRNFLLILAVILIVAGLFLLTQVVNSLKPSGQGALQVSANVKSKVILDGKEIGETPLCKCNQGDTIKQGEYTLTLEPIDTQFSPFVAKVNVEPNVLTVVDRTFLPGALASAYILTLEKSSSKDPQLFVGTLPDSAMVAVDNTPRGVTPFSLDTISASEHEVEIQKEGFAKKTIRVRTVPGYKLVVSAFLGTESAENASELQKASPTPTEPEKKEEGEEKEKQDPTAEEKNQVEILSTPVGFLRVRKEPTTSSPEIKRVSPGEKYTYTETQSGWYKITIDSKTSGWVSGTYVKEVSR